MQNSPTDAPDPGSLLSLPMPTHNFSVLPFLLNLSLDATDEDFGAEGDPPQEEQYDGNVMNRPLVKAFFLMAYILVFVSCVVGGFCRDKQWDYPLLLPSCCFKHLIV